MHQLVQALSIPGPSGTPIPINYPLPEFSHFSFSSIGDVITKLIPFLFAFAGVGLLLMLLSAGFTFLTSAGDAKKLEQGKQRLTSAIIGFLIIFVAYWLVQIAGFVFGITVIQNIFP